MYLNDLQLDLTDQQREHIAACIHYFGDGCHVMPEASNVQHFGILYVVQCCTEYFSDPDLRTTDRDEIILSVLDEIKNATTLLRKTK